MGLFKRLEAKALVGGKYYGTHPDIPGYYDNLRLTMSDAGVDVTVKKQVLAHFDWDSIIRFDADRQTETEGAGQRLSVTRMATLGVASLAAPKATGRTTTNFKNSLITTSGVIELETELEGGAGSSMRSMADNLIKKYSQKARAYVAQRARGKEVVK